MSTLVDVNLLNATITSTSDRTMTKVHGSDIVMLTLIATNGLQQ